MFYNTKELFALISLLFVINLSFSQDDEVSLSGIKFRSIGPAYASGRIADIEVNPEDHSEYYVAVAAGNVWKTNNAGITYKPIFDNYGSYSTADVAIDPNNKNIIWVGTGEYNSQRAIGYGDGVYVSFDRGKSFKNVGLKESEHIGRIAIDPRNSDVYVAAQGPLWGNGGDRGLYKTTDKGKTWKKILEISDKTGVTDVVISRKNPDVVYAASYQRRRRVYTLINGGPESAIYKSEDSGKTWRKLTSGLPGGDKGRIGLAVSPVDENYVYAIVEAAEGSGGVFRSTDAGESWTKMNSYMSVSPQYYNRLHCDPKNRDKIFSTDTYTKYSVDGGKTWTNLGLQHRHVDDHALWINPDNTNHLIIGGDGGIYETFDHGENWRHSSNLPVTQYYRVSVDNSYPFYNICGGTQDNNSMTGPSRTLSSYGILNSDWKTTIGGDGFYSAFDPLDPNIIYTEYQYGGLARYDKKSGEKVNIKPFPPKNEAYRWNWNAPLIISPHKHTRLYFAGNKLFRSEDRGDSWEVVSPDLTRQLNRNKLKVMGIVQSPEAVAKNESTSLFGNIVSLTESSVKEGVIYVGTDDGLIQITEDGGKNWRKEEHFPDVPDTTYVSCLFSSDIDENVVYACFDGRKNNDLKPYILKSTDKGKSWISIVGDLPERGTVYSIVEDFKNQNLLFAGTEFGLYFSINGGKNWEKLKNGIPTIAVRDIKIQKAEEDLVLATFGRGFYILDNYSPLREISDEMKANDYHLFPVKNTFIFNQVGAKYGQGATYYAGENEKYGACFTYYVKENYKTLKQKRKDEEKKMREDKKDIDYPTFEQFAKEDNEKAPYLVFTIKDQSGKTVKRLKTSVSKGVNRIYWDLEGFNKHPVDKQDSKFHTNEGFGMPVLPGKYTVSMSIVQYGQAEKVADEKQFDVMPLNNVTLPAKNKKALDDFRNETADTYASVSALIQYIDVLGINAGALITALEHAPYSNDKDIATAYKYLQDIQELKTIMHGNESISKRSGNQTPSVEERLYTVVYGISGHSSTPTQTMRDNIKIVKEVSREVLAKVRLLTDNIKQLEEAAKKAGAPYTPGVLPDLK